MANTKVIRIFVISIFIICSYTIFSNISYAGTLSSDIDGIDESKYPGYKSTIQTLQKRYNNSTFKVYYTGIDWTEAVTMEYQGHGQSPKNLFAASNSYKGKWYCPICGNTSYDTGWYCASIDAIKYMMDPRNSLDEKSVFQFKNLETADVTSEDIKTVINKKYSSYSYINNEEAINAITKASTDYLMNGYSILAKIVNEQGTGTSVLATGAGYEEQYVGYYNFFNVGAYGNGTSTVILNGLKYASNKGWDTVEKSILGGSEYYKSQYIGRGQNTLYYQRFNVVYTASLFSHQYQQDIMGAQTSATLLQSYYTLTNTLDSTNHEFIIPIYENMPTSKCSRPSTTEESELKYIGAIVLEDKTPVKASPNGSRIISYLNEEEKVKIIERAKETSADGNYWDTIVTETDGTYGYICRTKIEELQEELPEYVFNYKYYADNNSDVKAAYGYNEQKLIKHFVENGINEGRASAPTFSVSYYLEENADLKKAFGEGNYKAAYEHFLEFGCNECRKYSSEYDATFYKYYQTDLKDFTPMQLVMHYIEFGRDEERLASIDNNVKKLLFDAKLYADCNNDVKAVFGYDEKKLEKHWITNGIAEGRISSYVFNSGMYKSLHADLAKVYGDNNKKLFEHFVKHGINEGRAGNYVFDVKDYLSLNKDVAKVYGNNYLLVELHFIEHGIDEGRQSSSKFNVNAYMSYYEDLRAAFGSNYRDYYRHYLTNGISEGRKVI